MKGVFLTASRLNVDYAMWLIVCANSDRSHVVHHHGSMMCAPPMQFVSKTAV